MEVYIFFSVPAILRTFLDICKTRFFFSYMQITYRLPSLTVNTQRGLTFYFSYAVNYIMIYEENISATRDYPPCLSIAGNRQRRGCRPEARPVGGVQGARYSAHFTEKKATTVFSRTWVLTLCMLRGRWPFKEPTGKFSPILWSCQDITTPVMS